MKCKECHREATQDSPTRYCDLHWHLWFSYDADEDERRKGIFRGYPVEQEKWTTKRMIRDIRQDLKRCWRIYGRPKDWRSQWREVAVAIRLNEEKVRKHMKVERV